MMAGLSWPGSISAKRNPHLTPQDGERPTLGEQLRGLLGTWPLVVLVFACLGTVFLGWATPTEAAGLGVAAAIVVGFLFGELTLKKTWAAFLNTTLVFSSIVLVIIGSLILSQAVSILGLPSQVMQGWSISASRNTGSWYWWSSPISSWAASSTACR